MIPRGAVLRILRTQLCQGRGPRGGSGAVKLGAMLRWTPCRGDRRGITVAIEVAILAQTDQRGHPDTLHVERQLHRVVASIEDKERRRKEASDLRMQGHNPAHFALPGYAPHHLIVAIAHFWGLISNKCCHVSRRIFVSDPLCSKF